jgi:antitoxin VapB
MGVPQLNIKDAETSRLVRELAELTGESQTEVVRQAVKERLERHQRRTEGAASDMAQRLREVARKGAGNKLPGATSDHGFLYDDDGAPR